MDNDNLKKDNLKEQKHLLWDACIQKEIERKPIAERSADPASQLLLTKAAKEGIETAWDRYEAQNTQCGFGELGVCCRNCLMGPCRIDPLENGPKKGVCGATADTIVARNLIRMIAAGAAAHSDHGRDVTEVLHLVSQGKIAGYEIKEEKKLFSLAAEFGIEVQDKSGDKSGVQGNSEAQAKSNAQTGSGVHANSEAQARSGVQAKSNTQTKSKEEVARLVAEAIMDEFGTRKGFIKFIDRVPQKRREVWSKLGITPRGIDREIVEIMHRTHIGVDNDYVNLILQGLRASLSDGWGGSMAATELSDVLFGTPKIKTCRSNLGVLRADMVNIVLHGHEPLLSEIVSQVAQEPEFVALAREKGTQGINCVGLCCTGNEILMRRGLPVAGNFLQQELAIITGAVEAMVVDVQCIMPSLATIAGCYHTKIISTSAKAKFPGAVHIAFHEEADQAVQAARQIVRMAVENYPNRRQQAVCIPENSMEFMAGFSKEAIAEALGGSLGPLLDLIKSGTIRGIAAIVGCNNPKVKHDFAHTTLARELIKKDILVVETGCAAIACAKAGLLRPEAAQEAGPGLSATCRQLGIPPVLHMGSCVDISRILSLAAEAANALGVDISDLPLAGAAPEYMSEKAVSIGAYVVASGIFVLLGVIPPILGSQNVTQLLAQDAEGVVGARFAVEPDPVAGAMLISKHIEAKRKALGI
jgi:carbon-monoxide dehydrogenase catalytic subunit